MGYRRARPVRNLISVLCVAALGPAAAAEVRYVNANLATGAGTGTSWADAYRGRDGLAQALAAAAAGDELWVAAGTYTPTLTGGRAVFFVLKSGVGVYGGFTGVEGELSQRSPAANITILSGDVNGDDAPPPSTVGVVENSYHVVSGGAANATAVLDGFTITSGNASGPSGSDSDRGGGLICLNGAAPTVRACRIVNNRSNFGGGGVYLRGASPAFTACAVEGNVGGNFGGGCDMANGCNPVWVRCSFIGNRAVRAGGVEAFGSSNPRFTDCLFAANAATGPAGGGGLYILSNSTATLKGCTIVENTTASSGAGVLAAQSTVTLVNCIAATNTGPAGGTTGQQLAGSAFAASYSCIQGGFAGAGNVSSLPVFEDAAARDYRLADGSPGIDAGNSAEVGAVSLVDLGGDSRRVDDATLDTGVGPAPVVDMGCYERQAAPCPADFNRDGAATVQDVFDFLGAYFAGEGRADVNGLDGVSVQDIFDYLTAYFAGCV